MLRTNLSTRPFYNERGVHVVAGIVALLVLALAGWQVVHIVRLSRYKTELNTSIARDRAEAERRRTEAEQIRRGVDPKDLARVIAQSKEANTLIQQRTFSWTLLFNELEATLPENVMLVSVRPEFKDGTTLINLELLGRSTDDIEAFFERLEKTGAFRVEWRQSSHDSVTDQGLERLVAQAVYTPSHLSAKPAAVEKPGAPNGGRQ